MIDDSIIKKITDIFIKKSHPSRIHLFGSVTRRAQDPDSDLDLCITYRDKEPAIDLAELRLALRQFPLAIDLIAIRDSEFDAQKAVWWTIPGQATAQGEQLYERPLS